LGLRHQDRVVIFLDNSAETIISMYATLKTGAVFVVLNGTMKAPKLRYILENSDARVLITHTGKAGVVRRAIEGRKCRVVWIGGASRIPESGAESCRSWDDVFAKESTSEDGNPGTVDPRVEPIDTDLAALIYTSGSTGEPKGVMSSHHNMISAARSIIQYIGNTEDDVILNVLPLSFDYGLYQVLMTFMFGGTIVLEKSFVYLHQVLSRISEHRVTGFPIVPTILAMLLGMEYLTKYDFSSLRYLTNTGAALPVAHIRRLRELLPGVRIFSMYGLTECKRVCFLPPEEIDIHPDSVGRAIPNCRVAIVDGDGQSVPSGQTGELVIQGSNVMQGYWRDPDTTAGTYRPGTHPAARILHSGDFFQMDEEGFLHFVGRKDDMIKSKGERISPREVEDAVCAMPGVVEAAVVPVPDDILGQAIVAFVVPTDAGELTEREVLRHAQKNLEPFMVPKYVLMLEKLPRTPNGKVDKRHLAAQAEQNTQSR